MSNAQLTHLSEKTQDRDQQSAKVVFATFEKPDGNSFLVTFESVHPTTPRSIGNTYNLETADAYVALDMKSARGKKPPTGYQRMTLERLDAPVEHGWFRGDTQTAHVSFKTSFYLSSNELGKSFDLILLPKYLALQSEVDFSSSPQIVKGEIIASLPDNRIIIKDGQGKEISLQERQASYHDQIGKNYTFFVIPRKTIIKMSHSPSKDGENVGVLTSLVDIPNSTLKFSQFRTKEGLIAVTLEGNGSLSQKSLGDSFILETRDNYFLKEIKLASGKKGENIYTLTQVNNTLKHSIFTNKTGDIVVNHRDIDLSSTQMGQTFDLTLLKEFYAYKARIEAH